LDESVNTLNTVWGYRLKIDRDYLARAVTGIQQGPRKLLDVTSSYLREQAQKLRLRVQVRLSTEQMGISRRTEKLRSQPLALTHTLLERLVAKREGLKFRASCRLTRSRDTFSGLKQRFERDRFLRLLFAERERNEKNRNQLKARFVTAVRLKSIKIGNLKDRFKEDRIRQRIAVARNSLHEKMSVLKAVDPQTALQRGFALVYGQKGNLIRAINDVAEKEIIHTRLADGTIVSEVTAKEINSE
jgi:exodeoxyribonuclease VII large subunit